MPRRREPVVRKPKPKPQRRYTLPTSAPRGDAPSLRSPSPAVAPSRRTGVFGRPVTDTPLSRAQRTAHDRVDRARRRLPRVPVAAPPIIRNPTPTQARAARKLITQSITRAVGQAGSGRDRLARREEIFRSIQTDPRYAATRKAIAHYRQVEENDTALKVAKAYGARGTISQRLRAGQALLAARTARDTVKPGRPHTRVGVGGLATIDATALSRTIMGATSLQGASPENAIVKNALRDVGALGSAPFIGGYELGAGATEALTGRGTDRLERLGSGVVEGVKQSVPGRLVAGDLHGAAESFRQHPLFAALDLGAATAIVGRGAGAVARGVGSTEGGAARQALARAGSTVRSPLAIVDDPGAPSLIERDFSKDLTRKAAQAAADATREPLRDAAGKVVTVERAGRRVPVLLAHEGSTVRHPFRGERQALAHRQADMMASRANSVERMVRDEASEDMRVAGSVRGRMNRQLEQRGVKGRAARDLVAMVVEGTITSAKHFREDLTAHRDRLREQVAHPENYRDRAELDAAKARLQLVEKALTDPRVEAQAAKIVAVGEDIGRKLNATEKEAVAAGLLHEKRAARSRLVPAAIEHLQAKHHSAEEVQRLAYESMTPAARRARIAELETLLKSDPAVGAKIAANAEVRELRALGNAPARDVGKVGGSALKHGALRHADGRFMSNKDVEAFLQERGRDPETVAYLPHREMGGRAFHAQLRPGTRPVLDNTATRTGEAYRRGSTESSAELIRAQGVRQRIQLAKAQQLDKMVAEQGIRHPAVAKAERGEPLTKAEQKVVRRGGYFTGREAAELGTRLEHDTAPGGAVPVIVTASGERLTPMRAFAGRLDRETQRIIREDLQAPGAMETLGQRLLNDRFITDFADARARNVVLVPTDVVKRLEEHLRPAGTIEKFFQWLNRPFRLAVLPQPRWLTGNFVEPFVVRLTTQGSGLNVFGLAIDMRATHKVIRALEKGTARERQAAQEIRAHMLGGLFVGRRGASNRRDLSLPPGASRTYGRMVSKLPVVHTMAEMTRDLGHLLVLPLDQFFRVNRHIESAAQRAALGKHVRQEIQEFRSSWLDTIRLSESAIDEVKRGLVGTPTQLRLTRKLHEDLGKYEGYGPRARAWIQGPMPFLPWALNAARFVYWTMPAHRTIQTALLVKVNDVVAKEWAAEHSDAPEGGLKMAPRTERGGFVDIARYTPYGLTGPAAAGDLQGVTGNLAPQLQGTVQALEGKDPFGRDIRIDPSENAGNDVPNAGQKIGIAAYGLAEALTPYLSTGRRLREGGGTAFAGSTIVDPDVKPGTQHMSAARRVFDPFRPTYLGAPAAPVGAAQRGGAASVDDRIDAALERITEMDDAAVAQDERIARALDAIGLP